MIEYVNFSDLFAAIDFIKEKFPYEVEYSFENPTTSHLLSVFGDDGFIRSFQTNWIYDSDARWTYYFDIIYFKSEVDLIEFKLRFL